MAMEMLKYFKIKSFFLFDYFDTLKLIYSPMNFFFLSISVEMQMGNHLLY